LVGQIAEAAASAATLRIGAAGSIAPATLSASARRSACILIAPSTTTTTAASATAAGIVRRNLRRRRRERIDPSVDPLLGIGFRRGHNALDIGGLHTHTGQQLPHI